jgi:hypothetical protein
MAFARDVYTATSSQTDFVISFAYLEETHVVVFVDGVQQTVTTDYTLVSGGTTVRFNSGLTAGDVVVIERQTSRATRLTNYTAGPLTEADLDEDSQQAFFMAQESIDQAEIRLGLDTDEQWTADSKRIKDVSTPTGGNDAATKDYVDAVATGSLTTPLSLAIGGTGVAATDNDDLLTNLGAGTKGLAILKDTTSAAVMTELGITANGQSLSTAANYAAMRALLDLEAGTDFVAFSAFLNSVGALSGSVVAGDIFYGSAADTAARLAKGTDGQILTLASGVPAWEDGGGAWQQISEGEFTTVSVLDLGFTPSSWRAVRVILTELTTSETAALQAHGTDDNFATLIDSANAYRDMRTGGSTSAATTANVNGSAGATVMTLSNNMINDGTVDGHLDLVHYAPNREQVQSVRWSVGHHVSGTGFTMHYGAGWADVANEAGTLINGWRFSPSAGTFSGKYIVLGLVEPV